MRLPHSPSPIYAAHWNRRRFLKMAGLFSGAAALSAGAGCRWPSLSSEEDAHDDVVRTGYLPITDSAPLLVAHDKQFYRQEGLESERPTPYRSWTAIAKAFMAREVNVIHILMPASMWLRYQLDFPAKVVAWNHTNGSALTVHPSIQAPRDLAGRTIAIPFWYSIHNVVLQLLLKKYGLTPIVGERAPAANEVKLVILPPPDMFKALSEEAIAGYVVAEPHNSVAETTKTGKVLRLTGDVWRDHACCVVCMHESDVRDRPDWTQCVVNAIVKAQQWSRGNRPELAHLLSSNGSHYLPHSTDTLNQILNRYNNDFYRQTGAIQHPEWRSRRIDFQPYPFPSYTADLAKALKTTLIGDESTFLNQFEPQYIAQDLVDSSFVTKAINQVGGPQAFGLNQTLSRTEILEV